MGPIGTKYGESHRQGREVTKYREKTILLVLVFWWNLLTVIITTRNWTENRIHWRISPKYMRIFYPLLPVIRPTFEENFVRYNHTYLLYFGFVLNLQKDYWTLSRINNNTEHQKDGHHQLANFTSSDEILLLGPSNLNTFMVLLKMGISISISY